MKPADLAVGQFLAADVAVVQVFNPGVPGDFIEVDVIVAGRTAARSNDHIAGLVGARSIECLSVLGDKYRLFFDEDVDVKVAVER